MAFVDEITIYAKAGRGGNGVVRWRHEKGKDKAGAAGGNGGRGGDVYIRGVRDIGLLAQYRSIKEFVAQNGEPGFRNSMHGKDGDDLFIDVPIGSIVKNLETEKEYSILNDGETKKILSGGRGGLGNEHFKASTNVRPFESTSGVEGEEAKFHIELQLIADVGLIGLPNAGKSSLLNVLTKAKAKVGDYQFTTLEPNLGSLYGLIIADIPGLIEGASEGKGLGHKFLRHVQRTKVLLHCIAADSENVLADYETIRNELSKYSKEFAKKDEVIVITKKDTVSEEILKEKEKTLKKKNKNILTVSIIDDESVKKLAEELTKGE